jgi:hypothetical protein
MDCVATRRPFQVRARSSNSHTNNVRFLMDLIFCHQCTRKCARDRKQTAPNAGTAHPRSNCFYARANQAQIKDSVVAFFGSHSIAYTLSALDGKIHSAGTLQTIGARWTLSALTFLPPLFRAKCRYFCHSLW